MAFERITDADLQGKGVVGQPNNPGLSAVEMQKSVEQIPREVIVPAFNRLASQLEARSAAAGLGAAVPPDLPEETTATVQGVLEAVLGKGDGHAARADNPHAVTAAQTGAYTKAEADAAIARRVVEIGTGDMAQAVYDPTGQKKDVFAACATAEQGAKADTAVQTVNGRSGPAVTLVPELLWTNQTPNSPFNAQTLTLDTKEYTWFIIIYAADNGYRSIVAQLGVRQQLNSATYYNFIRPFTIQAGQVVFESCQYYGTYGSSTLTTYESGCVPWKIIGLM